MQKHDTQKTGDSQRCFQFFYFTILLFYHYFTLFSFTLWWLACIGSFSTKLPLVVKSQSEIVGRNIQFTHTHIQTYKYIIFIYIYTRYEIWLRLALQQRLQSMRHRCHSQELRILFARLKAGRLQSLCRQRDACRCIPKRCNELRFLNELLGMIKRAKARQRICRMCQRQSMGRGCRVTFRKAQSTIFLLAIHSISKGMWNPDNPDVFSAATS